MTRVDALYLPSTGHLLRILIPLEEPPHLTADLKALHLKAQEGLVLIRDRLQRLVQSNHSGIGESSYIDSSLKLPASAAVSCIARL